MLGFADGGYVPGPVGVPRLAMVHGGELVMNPGQQAAAFSGGSGGGDNGQVVSLLRRMADHLDGIEGNTEALASDNGTSASDGAGAAQRQWS